MKIRQIEKTDLPAVQALLGEGFPRKSSAYWQRALETLAARPQIGDLPRFGMLLETDGQTEGVMLMIASETAGRAFCNLSSWYVRPAARKYAPFLFQRSLRWKGVTYTDCSPAAHVLPIIEKFGFRPYSGGTLLLDGRAGLRRGAELQTLTNDNLGRIDPALRASIMAHLAYGCQGILLEEPNQPPTPLLYRKARLRRHVPAARFLFGDPGLVARNAGPLMRRLLGRGIVLALVDARLGETYTTGRILPDYSRRYFKGDTAPVIGDLRETEMALFGF